MRRLKSGQPVRIDLDGSDVSIDGRVSFVTGPVGVIAPVAEIDPTAGEELASGSLGYLLFTDRGAAVALRGLARRAPGIDDGVAFVVVDGVQIPQRRSAERLAFVTRARVCQLSDEGVADERSTTETVTADLSLGGARLTLRPGIRRGLAISDRAVLRHRPGATVLQRAGRTPNADSSGRRVHRYA